MDRPVLHAFVRELAGHERLASLAAALPARARVSEPALPLLVSSLYERLARALSVLVADDEKLITKLVSMALTDEGFRVVTAASSLTTAPRRPEAALHRRCRDARLAPIRRLAGRTAIAVQRQPDGD